eukprot:scaffold25441_cov41-Attheya_sp.AAC.2
MLDIVVPHSTADAVHSKLIDLLSQFSAPRYAFKAILFPEKCTTMSVPPSSVPCGRLPSCNSCNTHWYDK